MDIKKELKKIASVFLADEMLYKYDPKHEKKPQGQWFETESGWSKKDPNQKQVGSNLDHDVIEKANKLGLYPGGEPKDEVVAKIDEIFTPDTNPDQIMKDVAEIYKSATDPIEIVQMATLIYRNIFGTEFKDALSDKAMPMYNEFLRKAVGLAENKPSADKAFSKKPLAIQSEPKFKKVAPKIQGSYMYLIKDNKLQADEVQELAGFKETIKNNPRMSDKEYKRRVEKGLRLPRNQQQLKNAFIANMNPANYASSEAFNYAKQRVQKMSVSDFGKLLAALNNDENEEVL